MALDKSPEVCPAGIGETLLQALAKLFMREAEDQSKTVCGNLQLCTGLDSGIEGATHAVGNIILDRARQRRSEEKKVHPMRKRKRTRRKEKRS